MTPLLHIPALALGFLQSSGTVAPQSPSSNAWSALLSLPGAPVALALSAVALGVLLWLAGAKIIRPVGAIIGAILGIALGSGAIASILSDRLDLPASGVLALILGGLLGAAVGLVAYRLICAGLTGLSVAALVLLATVATLSPDPAATHASSPDHNISLVSFLQPTPASTPSTNLTSATQYLNQASADALDHSSFRSILPQSALDRWDALAPAQRAGVSLVAIAAGLLAAFAGLIAPKRASAFSASILGSGLALAGIAFLTQRSALDAGLAPTPWLIAWGLLALLGLAVQSGTKPQPASP
jgi:hypothetical protein